MDNLIPFGLLGDRMVAVGEVPRGRACGCVCPECRTALVARKGELRRYHFAHAVGNPNCKYGAETAIHLMAKQCLIDAKRIALPAFVWHERAEDEAGIEYVDSEEICPSEQMTFERALAEHDIHGLRPDVVAWVGDKAILIEIKVRHAVDASKLERLRARDVECVEIDLSKEPRDLLDLERLRDLVLEGIEVKRWLSHPRLSEVRTRVRDRIQGRVTDADAKHRAKLASFVPRPPRGPQTRVRAPQLSAGELAEPSRRIVICETCRNVDDLGDYREALELASFTCTRCGNPVDLSRPPRRRPARWPSS